MRKHSFLVGNNVCIVVFPQNDAVDVVVAVATLEFVSQMSS